MTETPTPDSRSTDDQPPADPAQADPAQAGPTSAGPTPDEATGEDVGGPSRDPGVGNRRKGLPIGPLGLFVATAIALLAAGLVIVIATRSGDDRAVDVNDVLDEVSGSALVPAGTDPVGVGDPAPDVKLDLLDGTTSSLSAFRGRPVVVNFWSSTCAPCLKEMPDLERVSNDHAPDVVVLGIDVTDTEKAGREMVERTGVTFANARDPQAEVFAAFGGTALPRTVIIDADGKVVEVHNGALTSTELTGMLRDNDLLS